jgi:hypothetical protein
MSWMLGMCYILCTSSIFGKRVKYLGGFSTHGFFVDGFLFLVKELELSTNLGHWVRVLYFTGSYMYIVL